MAENIKSVDKFFCPYCLMFGKEHDKGLMRLADTYLRCNDCGAVGHIENKSETVICWGMTDEQLRRLEHEEESLRRKANDGSK